MSLNSYEFQLYENFSSYRAHKWLMWSVSPCLLTIGSAGNALAVWVLWQGSKHSSTFTYLLMLGIADEVTLLWGLLRLWILHMFGVNLSIKDRSLCISGHLVSMSSTYLSVLLIVAVTVERVGMVQQKRVRLYSTSVAKARCICCGLVLASVLANVHWAFILDLYSYSYPDANVTVCDIKEQFMHLKEELAWLDSTLYCFLPFSIILLCNCRIIWVLRSARSPKLPKDLEMTELQAGRGETVEIINRRAFNRNFRQVTVTLLSVSGLFLITALPITALKVVTSLCGFEQISTEEFQSRYLLAQTCCELLMYANHSSNFFLYCLCGKKFRRELKVKLAACGFSCFHLQQQPNTTNLSDRH